MITKTYYSSVLCLGWLGFLWFQCQCIDQRDAQTNFCRQGSRVTGGGTVSVSKVAIFLCKLVTCMIYLHPVGVSLCIQVYFPGGVTPIISIVSKKSRYLCLKFFYLTYLYYIRIISVSRPVSSSSNHTESRALAQAERFLTN